MRGIGHWSEHWLGALALAGAGFAALAWGWVTGPSGGAAALAAVALGGGAIGAAGTLAAARRRPGAATAAPLREASTPDADAALARLRREAEEARAELDAIHSSVSHDLRSPIGAVLNFTTVLEEDYGTRLDDGGRAVLARIRRSAQSALALLDGLARLASAGRQPLAPRLVDVEELARDAFAAVRPADRAFELVVRDRLPPACADPELLQTALAELLANAVKFSAGREKARVTISGASDEGWLVYSVTDEGVGFDPRFTAKLFRVFERLHGRDEFPGAGAGLAVVRRIAERHGGRVGAEGALGRGATFRLFLPAPAGAAPQEGA